MNYHDITKEDMKNGPGLRAVLWVAGCNHYCKGCQNPSTWDPNGGLPFDFEAEYELFSYLDKDYCSGLTLSGGDPLYPENRLAILNLLTNFRRRYGWTEDKTVWLYTGYTMEELIKQKEENIDDPIRYILMHIDVLLDGEYVEEKRNINRYWVGSDNQRIWKYDENLGAFIQQKKQYVISLSEEQHEKEMGCC